MTRRVAIIGRTALAVGCLNVVRAAGDEIVAVIPDSSDDGSDGWQPSLRGAAARADVPILDGRAVNDPAFVAQLDALGPEFLLSFQAAPILRGPLIATARTAAVNLHYAPLPRYRGVSPIAWALINGETQHGVTLHLIDEGIDSGPIIDVQTVPIHPDDTGRTLYDRCATAGVAQFGAWWPRLRDRDIIKATPQDESTALYYNRWALDFADRRIRWTADCAVIVNRIRAFIFPPFQFPEIVTPTGVSCSVGSVAWDRGSHRGRPGEILAVEGGAVVVAAPGGRVTLSDLTMDGGVVARDDMAMIGLRPTDVLN